MSDVCTGVFAKRGVVPEDVVALSVFTFACFGWFVLQGVVVSTFIECFLVRRCCLVNQPKQANVKTDSATTSSGTTPRLAKTPVQTSDTNSSP